MVGQDMPASLAAEGCLMLQALLDELKPLPNLQLILPLDRRCVGLNLPDNAQLVWIDGSQPLQTWLSALIASSDAVWPIAPETDEILSKIAASVTAQDKTLLLSSPAAVALCSDKLATYQALAAAKIAAVVTKPLLAVADYKAVIKPRDGVGCQGGFICDNQQQLSTAMADINAEDYLIQPYVAGQAVSLSCLFKDTQAWLLCCNQQQIVEKNQQFNLQACKVNVANPQRSFYQQLIQQVAQAIPGLWGYIGIDLIESAQGPLILEVNPRLTTSYVGIQAATGLNVAQQVLTLLHDKPLLQHSRQQTVVITI